MLEQYRAAVPTDRSFPIITLLGRADILQHAPGGWEFFLTSHNGGMSYIGTVLHDAGYLVSHWRCPLRRRPRHLALRSAPRHQA